MNTLYLMITIISRPDTKRLLGFYKEEGLERQFVTVGRGTAASEMLDYFGLEASEKTVIMCVVSDSVWKKVRAGLRTGCGSRFPEPGSPLSFRFRALAAEGRSAF